MTDWFCPTCFGSYQPGSAVSSCNCPRECDHSGLDVGPCDCVDKRGYVKQDRCSRCCGKCNRIYKVWYKLDPRYTADIQADSPVEARHAGHKKMQNAGRRVNYTDMRARLYDRLPVEAKCSDTN